MDIWQTDALKSVGLAVPFVCFALVLRDWRETGWKCEGSWWGLALLAATALLVYVRDQMLLIITVNKHWLLQLPPVPLLAVIYAASFVLLFGGPRLLRKAWFPVLLMWAVIPVPQTFSSRIDVPLQHAGALVARNFARAIGVHLTTSDLKLMFSPDTGMFIAPGCDGLRGSITMGLTALVIAYLYRFRWYVFLPVVAGGVLLGYVFNFVRLCSMVIYDRISVSHPVLGPHEPLADHIVGGCIFFVALLIFFTVANRLKQEPAAPPLPATGRVPAWPLLAKAAAVVALAALFGADYLHGSRARAAISTVLPPMPASIGQYKLVRTWLDQNSEGAVAYSWGEYDAPDISPGVPGDHVSLGISPMSSIHDAEVCHIARGEDPIWRGQMQAVSPAGPVVLTTVMYNNGAVQKLEASTVCDGGACRQYSQAGSHVTVVYARPHKDLPMQPEPARAVPLMLKVTTDDVTTPAAMMEPRLQAELAAFLKTADLLQLTAVYAKGRQ
jgi:exosortase J